MYARTTVCRAESLSANDTSGERKEGPEKLRAHKHYKVAEKMLVRKLRQVLKTERSTCEGARRAVQQYEITSKKVADLN